MNHDAWWDRYIWMPNKYITFFGVAKLGKWYLVCAFWGTDATSRLWKTCWMGFKRVGLLILAAKKIWVWWRLALLAQLVDGQSVIESWLLNSLPPIQTTLPTCFRGLHLTTCQHSLVKLVYIHTTYSMQCLLCGIWFIHSMFQCNQNKGQNKQYSFRLIACWIMRTEE